MGVANLGDARGRIVLDASGVRTGIDDARSSLDRLNESGQKIAGMGVALTALTAPLTVFGKTGIDAAADFDAAMIELSARTGIVGADLDAMKQAAMDAGATTVFSAGDAANALLQLTSSGLSAQEALAVLPAVMDGAAASGMNLSDTADAVTDIMAQFGLEADQSAYVINSLTKAAGSGSASVNDLAMGFQNAGGIASMFGMSVDDTAAVLQVFSENGIKGAEAGTALKSMLTNMSSQVPDTKAAWAELGVSMFDAQGNVRDLNDVIADLNVAMAGMSEEERISYIQRLAGSYGQAGLNALLASGGIDEMKASMDAAADAQTVAEARMAGWKGATENLSGALETLQITVLTPLINDTLIPLVDKTTEVVNQMTAWTQKNPELAQQIMTLLLGLVALGPLLVIIGTVMSSTATVAGGLGTGFAWLLLPLRLLVTGLPLLGTLLSALLSPIGLLVIGVALLAAAWYANLGGIQGKVREVVDFILPYLQQIWDALKNADFSGAAQAVSDLFSGIGDEIVAKLPELEAKLAELLAGMIAWITEKAPMVVLGISVWAGKFTSWVVPTAARLLLALPGLLADMLIWILEVLPDITAQLLYWGAEFVAWVGPALVDLLVALDELAAAVLEWILAELIPAFLAEAPGIAEALISFVDESRTKVGPALLTFLTTVADFIATDLVPGLLAAALTMGEALVDGIRQGIENAWEGFKDYLGDKADEIADKFKDPLGIFSPSKVFMGIGENIVAGLALGLQDVNQVDWAMKGLVNAVAPGQNDALAGLDIPGRGGVTTDNSAVYNIVVQVPDALLRDTPNLAANADLFGQRLAEALQARG